MISASQSIHRVLLCGLAAVLLAACAGQEKHPDGVDSVVERGSAKPPLWYGRLGETPGRIVGYGEGPSREAAKQRALAEISQRLEVEVDSRASQSVIDDDGRVERKGERTIALSSRQRLKKTRIIREETDKNGRVFMAMEADFRPGEQILAEALADTLPGAPGRVKWLGSPWLVGSDFVRAVERQMGKQGGPEAVVRVGLARQNDHWLILLNGVSLILETDDLQRVIAWEDTDPQRFRLTLKSFNESRGLNRLKTGDNFALVLSNADVGGYYTLFNLYSDGRLVAMLDSQPLAAEQQFPSLEQQDKGLVLEAALAEAGKVSHDVILAVRTPTPVNTTAFRQISAKALAPGEAHYQIHRLLEWLDKTDIEAVSVLHLEIQP